MEKDIERIDNSNKRKKIVLTLILIIYGINHALEVFFIIIIRLAKSESFFFIELHFS